MLKLIKNGRVYCPEHMGKADLLIVGDKIGKIEENIDPSGCLLEVEVIDAQGKNVVPGFIDQHVHMIGGGGEAGFASRTPEVMLSSIIRAGITTLVGLLGTDGTTRQVQSLLAKARGLEIEGVTTYIYTGAYEIPTRTITGNVRWDIILIDKIIGVGEIAISDHRSAQPTKQELKRLAAEARVGGILSGKKGLVHLHVGRGKGGLNMVFEIVEESDIPISQFVPTHINGSRALLDQGIRFAMAGGVIDITSGASPMRGDRDSIKPSKAIMECLERGVPLGRITMSSDGNGSIPLYDEEGNIMGLTVASLESLHAEFRDLVVEEGLDMSEALQIITSNVAKVLGLYPLKGRINVGSHADIVILDEGLNIDTVIARGRKMMEGGKVTVKGTFE